MKYIPETYVYTVVKIEDQFTVSDVNRLTDDEIVALFNIAFLYVKEKLGAHTQYSMMQDKIMSERSIKITNESNFLVTISFYWEKEYEIANDITNFKSVELHLNNKILEDLKKVSNDKKIEWLYADIKNVRFFLPTKEDFLTEDNSLA